MNRAQRRAAKRTPPTRQHGALPKFWRPKLTASQRLDAGIIHWELVEWLADGTATREDLWDWIETGFTYSQMVRLLEEDGTEFDVAALNDLQAQLDSYMPVIERYHATGRVSLTAEQLQVARAAARVMDALLELDRHGIAVRAGQWAIEQTQRVRTGAAT